MEKKTKITSKIDTDILEKAKNAVFVTPGLTLCKLIEDALAVEVYRLERARGAPFQQRVKNIRNVPQEDTEEAYPPKLQEALNQREEYLQCLQQKADLYGAVGRGEVEVNTELHRRFDEMDEALEAIKFKRVQLTQPKPKMPKPKPVTSRTIDELLNGLTLEQLMATADE